MNKISSYGFVKYDKKILSITIPEITSYPMYANPYAIMQCHEESNAWLLSNFIQLCSNTKVLTFYDFNYKACPLLDVQRISKRHLKDWNIDLISFIVTNITNDCYIYLLIKKKYIDAYWPHNAKYRHSDNAIHDILIYGYDLKQEIFHIADNFHNGKYAFSKCTFEAMEKAIINVLPHEENNTRFKDSIELIKYTGDIPDLSVWRIYEALNDYYNCTPTGMWNIMEIRNYNRNKKWFFGIDCYEYIINKIINIDFRNTDIQDFHLIWEHKKHLKSIIEYLLDRKYIFDPTLSDQIDAIINLALIARNLILKSIIYESSDTREKLIGKYKRLREEEQKLIVNLLRQLKKCDMERLMNKNG